MSSSIALLDLLAAECSVSDVLITSCDDCIVCSWGRLSTEKNDVVHSVRNYVLNIESIKDGWVGRGLMGSPPKPRVNAPVRSNWRGHVL